MTPFKALLVVLAYTELNAWRRVDKPKRFYSEGHAQVKDRLRAYYRAVGKSGQELEDFVNGAANDTRPWSAAFISYLFATAGAGASFPVHTAHSFYVTAFKGNVGKNPYLRPFQAWPPKMMPLDVGDVICVWRDADPDQAGNQRPYIHGKKVSWNAIQSNNWQHFSSHCDLVVRKEGRSVTAIGGNVKNRVKETRYTLDKDGIVVHSKAIAVIKNFK